VPYGFSIRFRFPPGARLPFDEPKWLLGTRGAETVHIASVDQETALSHAGEAVLSGRGFSSSEEAGAAGQRWRDIAHVAFARLNIGVDFRERSLVRGGLSDDALEMLSKEHGVRVINDRPGVITFEEPSPLVASVKADAQVMPSKRRAAGTFAAARDLDDLDVGAHERLAFDLYAASFFQPSAEGRLLTAMMAIETLIEREPRPDQVRGLVDDLIRQVKEADLPDSQISSLVGAIKDLRNESIGQAGRRLVSVLSPREYFGMPPDKLFSRCYTLRSALVHGRRERPALAEIDPYAASLQMMVGELLGRRLIHVTEEWLTESVSAVVEQPPED
jgi:hypothetical protein